MTEIRFVEIAGPVEAFHVFAGRRRIGVVSRRDDRRWDVVPEGKTLRTSIEISRANALGALMDWWDL